MAKQKRKLKSRTKKKERNPAIVIIEEVEDSLLGVESHPSTINLPPQTTTPEPSAEPLQQILQRLDDMQSQITSLWNNLVKFLFHKAQLMQKKVRSLMKL